MRRDWRTATVMELQREGILLVEDGNHGEYRPRSDEFVDKGVAFIRAADMDDGTIFFDTASKINQKAHQRITKGIGAPGDILLSHKGTVGKVALVPDSAPPFVCSPQVTFWRTLNPEKLDRNYLYALLRSPGFKNQLQTRAGETDMAPYVSLTSQRGLSVVLPPITDQRAIGKILGDLDRKITVNQQMNETLDSIGEAIFKHWFIDFQFPDEAGRPYKSSGGHMVYNEELQKEIPKGWTFAKLRDFVSLERGLSYKGQGLSDSGLPMINLGTMAPRRGFIYKGLKFYAGEHKERHLVKPGELVIANTDITQKREVLGSPAITPTDLDSNRILFTHHIYAVRNASTLPNLFIYYLLQLREYRERVRGFATGTTVLALPQEAILDLVFANPTSELLKKFTTLMENMKRKSDNNIMANRVLSKIRNLLLPRLISGRIQIPVETE